MKNWFSINAKAGADSAEVSIFDEIGYWGVNAKEFLRQFKAIEAENVTLFINSPGGSVFEAVAMFNGMKASGKNITVHVLGIAASAASYIAMVGNKIVMPENSFMMVHNPLSAVYGNADEMRDMADLLDKVGDSLMATYVKRTGKDADALKELFDAESYLTAAECVDLGLCDEILPAVNVSARFDFDRPDLPANVQAIFKAAKPPTAPLDTAIPFADQVAALAAEPGFAEFADTWAVTLTTLDEVRAAISAAVEVRALCALMKLPDEAAGMIRAGKSLAEVRATLAEELAARDERTHTSNVRSTRHVDEPTPAAAKGLSPAALWAKIHQNEASARKA